MGRPTGQLDRSLAALTIGMQMGREARKRSLLDSRTGEYEQQVHVPLSGGATAAWGFADQRVNWELAFLYAPLQRRVPFQQPHFTHGFEMVGATNTEELVLLSAHVLQWTITDEGWYAGAAIRFASCAPNASETVPYNAIAHLSFQGFAATVEGEEFQT